MKELITIDDSQFEEIASYLLNRYDNSKLITIGNRGRCRFCGADSPKFFKKKAHVIPHSLGNSRLVSDDECDECNQRFGKYDEQLFRFFAPHLPVAGFISDKKTPKIQDRKVSVHRQKGNSQHNDHLYIEHKEGCFEFSLSNSNCTLEIDLPRSRYRPVYVYLALCKQALNLLPINDLVYFKNLLRALQDGDFVHDENFPETRCIVSRGHCIGSNFLTNEKREPKWLASILMKKKKDCLSYDLPKYVYMFAFNEVLLQIQLPSDDWFNRDFISYEKDKFDLTVKYETFKIYSIHEDTMVFSGTEERESPFNKLTIKS
ncbi:MAG: HNH endonuclease [Candidatus Electronema sp. V4]|uniref:HNH endonuclease n=1 Tax=Candidatus Electronema sp. V4 TaxID=3454756 RepID=UPI0040554DAB